MESAAKDPPCYPQPRGAVAAARRATGAQHGAEREGLPEMQAANAAGLSHRSWRSTVAEWVEGPRAVGWFGVRWRRKGRLSIAAYRCLSYGYLESHANTV